ncbi:hypothetical protein PCASD_26528 [Puccinia coronata f. sp. avenae]|uniref:Uncharacterized protein n=1 Tax=Puccinia coronata f. sp. avenae TaxID=200324 RepID=A0A2N5RUH2_9BASI|nr:hypothetical protein PCASD_26528 [Puccinia coronata f. sp. avenae]
MPPKKPQQTRSGQGQGSLVSQEITGNQEQQLQTSKTASDSKEDSNSNTSNQTDTDSAAATPKAKQKASTSISAELTEQSQPPSTAQSDSGAGRKNNSKANQCWISALPSACAAIFSALTVRSPRALALPRFFHLPRLRVASSS